MHRRTAACYSDRSVICLVFVLSHCRYAIAASAAGVYLRLYPVLTDAIFHQRCNFLNNTTTGMQSLKASTCRRCGAVHSQNVNNISDRRCNTCARDDSVFFVFKQSFGDATSHDKKSVVSFHFRLVHRQMLTTSVTDVVTLVHEMIQFLLSSNSHSATQLRMIKSSLCRLTSILFISLDSSDALTRWT
jgi:hypothetical protein